MDKEIENIKVQIYMMHAMWKLGIQQSWISNHKVTPHSMTPVTDLIIDTPHGLWEVRLYVWKGPLPLWFVIKDNQKVIFNGS